MLKRISILVILSLSTLSLISCDAVNDTATTSDSSKSEREIAIAKIIAYAEDGQNPIPTLENYRDAGVSGVTEVNLTELNALVDSLNGEDVDTVAELEALTTRLGTNIAPVANAGKDLTAQINQPINISGTATDVDGTIASYQWKKGAEILASTASFRYTPTSTGTDR